jgi:signal peptidase I
MPNEVIRIDGGDLWVQPLDRSRGFERLRRTLDHQQAIQLMVYDDGHRASVLRDDPRWRRWAPAFAGNWAETAPGVYSSDDRARDWAELRYRHLVPSPNQWRAIQTGKALPGSPRPTLITDYYSYNTTTPT